MSLSLVTRACLWTLVIGEMSVRFLYTASNAGSYLPTTITGQPCSVLNKTAAQLQAEGCSGGVAERIGHLKYMKQQALSNGENVITVEVGNWCSMLLHDYACEYDQTFFRLANYDVFGLGLQDFYTGDQGLTCRLSMFDSANKAVVSNFNGSHLRVQPYVTRWRVVHVGGVQVGFLGAVDPRQQWSWATSSTMRDVLDSLVSAKEELLASYPRCRILVLLATNWDDDTILLQRIPELDVVLHGVVLPRIFGPLEGWADLDSPDGKRRVTLFTSALDLGVGDVKLTFSDDGSVIGAQAARSNHSIIDSYAAQIVEKYEKAVQQNSAVVVGETKRNIGGSEDLCSFTSCPLGMLVNTALLEICQDCDLALFHTGGLKTALSKGNITMADVDRAYPSALGSVSFFLYGVDLVTVLEVCSEYAGFAQGGAFFLQSERLRYAYNANHSIIAVFVLNKYSGHWEAVQMEQEYKVVTNSVLFDFLRDGLGQGQDSSTKYTHALPMRVDNFLPRVQEVVRRYVEIHSPLDFPDDLSECAGDTFRVDPANPASWPAAECNVLRSEGTIEWRNQCPTNFLLCENYSLPSATLPFPGLARPTSCHWCSGFGTCSNRSCVCDVVTTGRFKDIDVMTGADCGTARTNEALPFLPLLYAATLLPVAAGIWCTVCYVYYRDMAVIRRSSPLFCHIITFGCWLVSCGLVITLDPKTMGETCMSGYIISNIGFVVTYSSLFAKTYRIYRIFIQQNLKIIDINNKFLVACVCSMVLVEIVIDISFAIIDPLKLVAVEGTDTSTYFLVCDSTHAALFRTTGYIWKSIILLFGVFLAVQTRDVFEDYNESRAIGFCIYNVAFLAALCVPTLLGGQDGLFIHPQIGYVLRLAACNWGLLMTQLGLMIPKVSAIRDGRGNNSLSNLHSVSGIPSRSSHTPLKMLGRKFLVELRDVKGQQAKVMKIKTQLREVDEYRTLLTRELAATDTSASSACLTRTTTSAISFASNPSNDSSASNASLIHNPTTTTRNIDCQPDASCAEMQSNPQHKSNNSDLRSPRPISPSPSWRLPEPEPKLQSKKPGVITRVAALLSSSVPNRVAPINDDTGGVAYQQIPEEDSAAIKASTQENSSKLKKTWWGRPKSEGPSTRTNSEPSKSKQNDDDDDDDTTRPSEYDARAMNIPGLQLERRGKGSLSHVIMHTPKEE